MDTTTAVGAALLKAHRELLARLRELEAAPAAPAEAATPWCVRLDGARAVLADHFRFEEEGGYMDAVLQREPELGHKVEELRQQHVQLLAALDELRTVARTPDPLPAEFGERVRAWVRQLRHHESQENLLVQEAFNVNTAAED